jgi:hypothetical protein
VLVTVAAPVSGPARSHRSVSGRSASGTLPAGGNAHYVGVSGGGASLAISSMNGKQGRVHSELSK